MLCRCINCGNTSAKVYTKYSEIFPVLRYGYYCDKCHFIGLIQLKDTYNEDPQIAALKKKIAELEEKLKEKGDK